MIEDWRGQERSRDGGWDGVAGMVAAGMVVAGMAAAGMAAAGMVRDAAAKEKHNPGLPPRAPDLRWWMAGAKKNGGWEGSNLDGPQDELWHGWAGLTTAWWPRCGDTTAW